MSLLGGVAPQTPLITMSKSCSYFSDGFIKIRSCSFSLFQCARAHNDLIPCFHTNLHLISRLMHLTRFYSFPTRFLLVSTRFYSFQLISTRFLLVSYSFQLVSTRFYSFLLVSTRFLLVSTGFYSLHYLLNANLVCIRNELMNFKFSFFFLMLIQSFSIQLRMSQSYTIAAAASLTHPNFFFQFCF